MKFTQNKANYSELCGVDTVHCNDVYNLIMKTVEFVTPHKYSRSDKQKVTIIKLFLVEIFYIVQFKINTQLIITLTNKEQKQKKGHCLSWQRYTFSKCLLVFPDTFMLREQIAIYVYKCINL